MNALNVIWDRFLTYIRSILSNRTFQGAGILIISQILGALLNFLINIGYSRLDVDTFNQISLFFLIMPFAQALSELGLGISFINYYGKIESSDLRAQRIFIIDYIKIRLLLITVILGVGLILQYTLLPIIYPEQHNIHRVFFWSICAAGSMIIFNTFITIFTAQRNFEKILAFQLCEIVIRIGIIFFILFLSSGLIQLIFMVQILVPLGISIVMFLIFNHQSLQNFKKDSLTTDQSVQLLQIQCNRNSIWSTFEKLFRIGKYIILTFIFTAIYENILTPFIIRYATNEETNNFYLAMKLIVIFTMISSSINTVNLTEINKFTKREEFSAYFKRNLKLLVPLAVFLLVFVFGFAQIIIDWLFPGYRLLILYFQILSIAYIAQIIIYPITLILYPLGKPYYYVYNLIIGIILLAIFNFINFSGFGIIWRLFIFIMVDIFIKAVVLITWSLKSLDRTFPPNH
jgi:O-antigen/teichoic acid export membrane protein